MTPLELVKTKANKICCNNCKNRMVINNTNFCECDGKIILDMHLDTNRHEQCKDKFNIKED